LLVAARGARAAVIRGGLAGAPRYGLGGGSKRVVPLR
jgi:hypothetical protein